MVIEKMKPENSSCARGANPPHATVREVVTFKVQGALATKKQLYGWFSDLDNTDEWPNQDVFKKQFDITLAADGTFSLTVGLNKVITVTTLTTGAKGYHTPPPPAPFPTSYFDDFESSELQKPGRYWFDQMGAWEVQTGENKNRVMRQVATVWPQCWGYSCSGPKTHFGPAALSHSTVSLDVKMEDEGEWTLNKLTIGTDGKWSFEDLRGTNVTFKPNVWHHVEYTVASDYTSASLDGVIVFVKAVTLSRRREGEDAPPMKVGEAAVAIELNRYIKASVDNFRIEPIAPEPSGMLDHEGHGRLHHARRHRQQRQEQRQERRQLKTGKQL